MEQVSPAPRAYGPAAGTRPSRNGIYALASLDGAPLAPRDLAVLGLDGEQGARAPGCHLLAHDVRPGAIHVRAHADGIDTLLGHLDEPEEAARTLGLVADADPLALAIGMAERFGEHAPDRLPGAWLLVRWDARRATMTLVMAERVRDTCHVATDGRRLALSPELARLARLDWVDAAPDPTNLLLSVGRARLRDALGNRTMLRDVVRVLPGTSVTVRAHDLRASAPQPPAQPPLASVSFEEAIEELDRILGRMMRQHFAREGDTAIALSGGLDSSLLALYAARERGDRALTFLTSAAPPDSDLPDESAFAAIVATHLGIPLEKVSPSPSANAYRPSARMFGSGEMPLASVRHYLDETLELAALGCGATALLNGNGGEMTVTHDRSFLKAAHPVRALARLVRNRLRGAPSDLPWPLGAFHVRLSRAARDRIPADFADIWRSRAVRSGSRRLEEAIGIEPGFVHAVEPPLWSIAPSLRTIPLFHDGRLIRYGAALPLAFTQRDGYRRAIVRALMRGKLPDSIAFRQSKMPYSPTYSTMLKEQAEAARERVALFRSEGIGEWIDLDWLERQLREVGTGDRHHLSTLFQVQSSAIFAEFLIWWGER